MFDFDDELIIESYRIPWLIWIQLLVMLLLVILLYYYSNFTLDPSNDSDAVAPPSSTGILLTSGIDIDSHMIMNQNNPLLSTAVPSCLHNSKVGEHQSMKDIGTSTNRGIARKEDIQAREGSSRRDSTHGTLFEHSHHPCHYLGLAKRAFLKCLGLDFTSENSSSKTE